MSALYWFALIVGVGMFLVSIGADFLDADVDAHADIDADVHVDADHGAEAGHGFRILSVRNATYFLFAFGVTGSLLSWLWGGSRGVLTAALAGVLGVTGAAISSLTFGWVKKTESGAMLDDQGWVGMSGEVTLPISATTAGKIEVIRGGRTHELTARPFDAEPVGTETWKDVMVIEMQQGVAMVVPRDTALNGGDRIRIAPGTES
jgi:hypothetical protein